MAASSAVDTTSIPWAAVAPIVLLAVGFVVWVVVDIVRSPSVQYLPKWAWALLAILSVPLGGVIYLLVGRHRDY